MDAFSLDDADGRGMAVSAGMGGANVRGACKAMLRKMLFVSLLSTPAAAMAVNPQAVSECTNIDDVESRLACYDRAAGRVEPGMSAVPAPEVIPTASMSFGDPRIAATSTATPMQARWELTEDSNHGKFRLRPHNQNYLVVKFTSNANDEPFTPLAPVVAAPEDSLDKQEVKFQLSLKSKLAEDLFLPGANLWMGYTQESHWQVFNEDVSRPFRETNYEPELIWVAPVSFNVGDLQFRYASLGLVHQSNGRADPLSRSWDRVYAEIGAEMGNFGVWVKPWWRIPESSSEDDNPDIEKYIGRGEIVGVYRNQAHVYSLRVRNNFSTNDNRGSLTADWSFPLTGALRGYVRAFSGYGESLIDYNWRQHSLGIGVLLTDRL